MSGIHKEYRFDPAPLPEPVLLFLRAVEPVVNERAWMDDAACQGKPSELFFPAKGDRRPDGREICAGCPVRVECLDYAVTNSIHDGLWGGVGALERRRLRVAQQAEAS